jgi:hypothetical protein
MPIYRNTRWPSHRAASQAFLDKLTAQLETHEATMGRALAESLEGSWPEAAIPVDITAYAFEILFHESAHTRDLVKSLDDSDYVPYPRAAGQTKRESASAFYMALEKSWDLGDTLHDRALIAARTVAGE